MADSITADSIIMSKLRNDNRGRHHKGFAHETTGNAALAKTQIRHRAKQGRLRGSGTRLEMNLHSVLGRDWREKVIQGGGVGPLV